MPARRLSPKTSGSDAGLPNREIGASLHGIADILEMEQAPRFRIEAYRNAARVVTELPTEIATLVARGRDLRKLTGISKDMAQKVAELALTGTIRQPRQRRNEASQAIAELTRLPGLGPRRAKTLHAELGITTLPELHRALKAGRVSRLAGFSEYMAQRLLKGTEALVDPSAVDGRASRRSRSGKAR